MMSEIKEENSNKITIVRNHLEIDNIKKADINEKDYDEIEQLLNKNILILNERLEMRNETKQNCNDNNNNNENILQNNKDNIEHILDKQINILKSNNKIIQKENISNLQDNIIDSNIEMLLNNNLNFLKFKRKLRKLDKGNNNINNNDFFYRDNSDNYKITINNNYEKKKFINIFKVEKIRANVNINNEYNDITNNNIDNINYSNNYNINNGIKNGNNEQFINKNHQVKRKLFICKKKKINSNNKIKADKIIHNELMSNIINSHIKKRFNSKGNHKNNLKNKDKTITINKNIASNINNTKIFDNSGMKKENSRNYAEIKKEEAENIDTENNYEDYNNNNIMDSASKCEKMSKIEQYKSLNNEQHKKICESNEKNQNLFKQYNMEEICKNKEMRLNSIKGTRFLLNQNISITDKNFNELISGK